MGTTATLAPDEAAALDAYSTVVTSVAKRVAPTVASLRVGRHGAGSAVVLTPDGFLVTSAHVVEAASSGTATFTDGSEAGFDVVGRDRLSDLAVVRVQASGLRPAGLGDADTLQIGQLVVAVGNPLGYAGSVTAGIVSGLGRSLVARTSRADRVIENVIQTDAALNPGNSGGALVDSSARVVGICTAVAGVGLGLGVPVNDASRRILAALMRDGRVSRAWLGVVGGRRPLPPRLADRLDREAGVGVVDVVAGSPAARAGIRPTDVILDLGGTPVESAGDLQRLMVGDAVGRHVRLRIVRGGEVAFVSVTPEALGDTKR